VLTRRAFIAGTVGAAIALFVPRAGARDMVTCADTTGIERKVPCAPLALGPIHKPIPEFTSMRDPVGDGFTGAWDPTGSGRIVVRNVNHSGQTERHTTMGTDDSIVKGSTSYLAFRYLFLNKAEFTPSDWNLVAQLQMKGSPIFAVSVDKNTVRWFLNSRDGTISKKIDLGPVVYGQWEHFVVGCHLADKPDGWTELWWGHGDWPDVSKAPLIHRGSIQTWQGEPGRHTVGLYAAHSKADTYVGYWDLVGRAATAQRAIEIAR
jgi:hypothetical protein